MIALIFFCVTVFLMIQLHNTLGTKVGADVSKNHEHINAKFSEEEFDQFITKEQKIKKYYPNFQKDTFLDKSQKVFQIIFEAYASENTKIMKDLMTDKVLNAFSMAIENRKKRGEQLQGNLVRFLSTDIVDVSIVDSEIFVIVNFVTEQSNILTSKTNEILEGDQNFVETIKDFWTFSRKIGAHDNKWYLCDVTSEKFDNK